MGFSLTHGFSSLSADEQSRIKRRLGIIPGNPAQTEKLQKTLRSAFQRLQSPCARVSGYNEKQESFFIELMQSFGSVHKSKYSPEDLEEFSKLPFVVFNNQTDSIHVASEALDSFLHDRYFLSRNYLISFIYKLPAKEKQAWLRWLGVDKPVQSREHLNRFIWKTIARERKKEFGNVWPFADAESSEADIYLDEVFDAEPSESASMPWFYKGLIPFYRAASEELQKDGNTRRDDLLRKIRLGFYVCKEEKQGFGQPLRWKLIRTLEKIPGPVFNPDLPGETGGRDSKEQSLF